MFGGVRARRDLTREANARVEAEIWLTLRLGGRHV